MNTAELTPWTNDLPGLILGDVTSRDGLQSLPWWNYWNKEQRGELAVRQAELGIHHQEIGFPAMIGDPEYDAVKHTANSVGERESVIFGLARLVEDDVINAISAIDGAKYKGVHTFVGTSPEHLSTFSFDTDTLLGNVTKRVEQIRNANCIAQFSAEDATRTDLDLLVEVYEKAALAGAQILNIPDTLGFYDVEQYLKLLKHLQHTFPQLVLSAHTHNDKSQAEQNALVAASQGFVQKIEGTIFGIGERAGNADLMTIAAIIIQDPKYSHLAEKLLKNPNMLGSVLEYMEEISGLHMRPESPGYGYGSIVNRSGIHQAKVAKMKKSYIAYPGNELGLGDRPTMEISALSGYHGVIAKFEKTFGISLDEITAKDMTAILRNAFSPDTTPNSMHNSFPKMSSDFFYSIGIKIRNIWDEARTMKNTRNKLIEWNSKTDEIIKEIYDEYMRTKKPETTN